MAYHTPKSLNDSTEFIMSYEGDRRAIDVVTLQYYFYSHNTKQQVISVIKALFFYFM